MCDLVVVNGHETSNAFKASQLMEDYSKQVVSALQDYSKIDRQWIETYDDEVIVRAQ